MNRPGLRLSIVAAIVFVTAACTSDPTGEEQPATVALLRLTSPHIDDGALLFTVTGPPIDSATTANASLRLFTSRVSDTTLVGALVGPVGSGAVVTLHGASQPARYVARLVEVADRRNFLRESLIGYALTVVR